jgi:hypothetical protein
VSRSGSIKGPGRARVLPPDLKKNSSDAIYINKNNQQPKAGMKQNQPTNNEKEYMYQLLKLRA